MNVAQLVRGRAVLTGRLDLPEIPDGAVLVEDGYISAVGPYAELRALHPDAAEIGSNDRVVMPGLVSAHQHGGGASSVQLGCEDQPFERWLIDMLRIPPLDVRQDTAYHALRLLESGVTTTIHSHYVRDPGRYRAEVGDILAGYAKVGLRVAFAPHFIDRNFLTYGEDELFLAALEPDLARLGRSLSVAPISVDEYVELVDRLAEDADPARERILFGPVAPQWCTSSALERIGAAAVAAGRGAHLHLVETPAQRAYLDDDLGGSVVARLESVGLLRPEVSLAHGVHLVPEEMERIAARGATIVLNPGCNLRLGNGSAPVARLLEAGVALAVGTDDMTLDDDDDLLGELRLVRGLARIAATWPSPAQLLHMATAAGARAAGFADTGTLERGKRADIVLLDASRLVEPVGDAANSMLELVVSRARAADVHTVLLDGRIRLESGRWIGGDRRAIIAAIRESAERQMSAQQHREFTRDVRELAVARGAWRSSASIGREASQR